jgi:hypothetical protein
MYELENIIKQYLNQEVNIIKSRIKEESKLEKIFYYLGYEILPFCYPFFQINSKICGFSKEFFQENDISIYGDQLSKINTECKKKTIEFIQNLNTPPTHIKATHDVSTNTTTFEYEYEKLLDEDKDDFGKIFDQWQYQLGKPRPVPIEVPEGYHLEVKSTPVEEKDSQGRVTKITSELSAVIVKDSEGE